MTLKEMIEQTVKRSIADILGADVDSETREPERLTPLRFRAPDGTVDVAKAIEPRQTRKRGRGRAKVAYVKVIKRGRQIDAKKAGESMAHNVRVTWLAVANAKAPISARDLETKTSLGKKAVESAVYALRTAGLIESRKVAE